MGIIPPFDSGGHQSDRPPGEVLSIGPRAWSKSCLETRIDAPWLRGIDLIVERGGKIWCGLPTTHRVTP